MPVTNLHSIDDPETYRRLRDNKIEFLENENLFLGRKMGPESKHAKQR